MTASKKDRIYLSELLQDLATLTAEQDLAINSLQLDSRALQAGDCFIAIKGGTTHGVDFIPDAISKGVAAILVDSEDEQRIEQLLQLKNKSWNIIFVEQLSQETGLIAHRFYGLVSSKMKTFAVTGTNGKTSVSHFIAQAIDHLSGKGSCGVIGTLGNGLIGDFISSGMTTPSQIQLHQSLAKFYEQDAQAVVVEASSHGLSQHRLSGVDFDVAVFTNLSRDHLDYHENMQSYGEAKLTLFKDPDLDSVVINLDDPFFRQIVQVLSAQKESNVSLFAYGLTDETPKTELNAKTIHCQKLNVSISGLSLEIKIGEKIYPLKTRLLGRFNASNLLAALAALIAADYDEEKSIKALSNVNGVPGRMEVFSQPKQASVVVDFAHTPDGLYKALETLSEICTGQLYCIFGCGGDRDKGKRALMGAAAEKIADQLIITNDNPRSEDPNQIANGILEGIQKPERAMVILSRKQAIETAINSAQAEDIILVAGKGHEDWQEIKGQRFPFNDRNVVLNLITNKKTNKGGQHD